MKVQAATAVHPTQTTVVPPMNMMQSTLMVLSPMPYSQATVVVDCTANSTNVQPLNNGDLNSKSCYGDDEPPEETPVVLKRSHLLEEADEDMAHAEIRNTFQMMGFCVHPEKLPKGELIYRKRPARLRPPKFRKNFSSKTYFDDDGNPYTLGQSKDSQDEREMQTDDDGTEVKSDTERAEYVPSGTLRTHPLASQDTSLDDDSIRLAEAAADTNDEEHREGKAEDGESTDLTKAFSWTVRVGSV
ncbi:hypothetical protein PYW07_013660 [Mythimna separata]|uniref:Uncharacterized protein n=1 Tax=Mythimna separata TaxID=271217 RepID=A0AAD7YF41_MYTSE|nr:hypothetical protein PYW07_013660 [Mythimna separata]